MGGDIAAWCALRGLEVTLQDREQKYVDPAMKRAGKLFTKRIRDDDDRADHHHDALAGSECIQPVLHAPASRIWMRLLILPSGSWVVPWIEAVNRPESLTTF